MQLTSSAFRDRGWIPRRHTGDGANLSPPLAWSGAPAGVGSFALILDDPEAPSGPWIHWVLYDIPASLQGLAEGVEPAAELANGARQGRCWGVDAFSRSGYQGPLPPPGPAHCYRFQLMALDCRLGLPPGASAAEVRRAAAGHRLAQAELLGLYRRC